MPTQPESFSEKFERDWQELREKLGASGQEFSELSDDLARGMRKTIHAVAFDGKRLSTALNSVARQLSGNAYRAALAPITKGIPDALIGSVTAALGGGGAIKPRMRPFARGGVVRGATPFATGGGLGVMGEAGPEAILPLSRGADGRLGVRGGGAPVNITMNITTPNVQSFERSRSAVAARAARAIARARRGA